MADRDFSLAIRVLRLLAIAIVTALTMVYGFKANNLVYVVIPGIILGASIVATVRSLLTRRR